MKLDLAKLKESVETDVSGKWINIDQLENIAKLIGADCAIAVSKTGTQCAYTTHDLGTVECTITRCTETVKEHFGIK